MSTTLNGFTFADNEGLTLATNTSGDIGIRVYQPYNSWGSCYVFIDTLVSYDPIDNTATITINGAKACHDLTTSESGSKMYGTMTITAGGEEIELFNLSSSKAWKLTSNASKNSPKAMSNVTPITTAKIPCNEDGTCTVKYSASISVNFPLGTGNTFNMTNQTDTLSNKTLVYEHTHDYSFSSAVTPSTCTEQGYTTYTCECGGSYMTDYTDALGHSYVDDICSVCGFARLMHRKYKCYIGNGTELLKYKICIDNGANWNKKNFYVEVPKVDVLRLLSE